MAKFYLAMDIGCIECGESSKVIGIYKAELEAETACNLAEIEQAKDWHGQHHFKVFEIEVPNA